jgi:hypothetical protein
VKSPPPHENFVHVLYRERDFDAFDDFSDFVESTTCEASKSCQVRGSNPCRGATIANVFIRLSHHSQENAKTFDFRFESLLGHEGEGNTNIL